MSNKKNILSVNHLSKIYHDIHGEVTAIEDVNFTILEKEFVSIVGPSGCGKSTILSILSGIDNDYTGKIIGNKNLTIGYMLQTDSLFPWRTILENCFLGLEIQNKLTIENKNYVIGLLKKYGLEDFMDKYPSSLSGGMKQRVVCLL